MTDAPSDPSALHSARAAGRQLVAKRREEQRKAALKANMARRKAQVRGRAATSDPQETAPSPEPAAAQGTLRGTSLGIGPGTDPDTTPNTAQGTLRGTAHDTAPGRENDTKNNTDTDTNDA